MTRIRVKQTNKTEIQWSLENERLSITAVVAEGKMTSVTVLGKERVTTPRSSFLILGSNELDSLIEGLQCVREKITSTVWKDGIAERNDEA